MKWQVSILRNTNYPNGLNKKQKINFKQNFEIKNILKQVKRLNKQKSPAKKGA